MFKLLFDDFKNLLVRASEGWPPVALRLGTSASPSSKKISVGAIIFAISYTFSRLDTAPCTGLEGIQECKKLYMKIY